MNREDYIKTLELENAELKKENRELKNKSKSNHLEKFTVELTSEQIYWILVNYFKQDEILTKNEINVLVNDLIKDAIFGIKETIEHFKEDLV